MAAPPILLVLVWHMHQPDYRPAGSGEALLPWTRLHATKDYRDMVAALAPYSRVRCTFNLTPVLLDQLERIGAGEGDVALRVARVPAADLTDGDRALLFRYFFSVHHERKLEPEPRYRELLRRSEEERAGGRPLNEEECRDLQVWFHLAWVDPSYGGEEPIRSLRAKGKRFTESEKESLLDWTVRLSGTVVGAYREAAASGRIELSTSAHHHPILPLLVDTDATREAGRGLALPVPPFRAPADAAEQLRSARASHERRFGTKPRGLWPPEGAVSDAALELVRAEGFAWVASDETVLARALRLRDGALRGWPSARYRPYRVPTASGPVAMIFRDRALSDQIGFAYRYWDAEAAAEDFLARVRGAGAAHASVEGKARPAVVAAILDGENCWEAYPDDGWPFLEALYGRLERDSTIEAVTVSEALERVPPVEELPHVPVGSWIRDDLGIWIGHPEKNRAWEALRDAHVAILARGDAAPEAAWQALYAAEASDWFWWYGDDHESAHKDVFDTLFRAHVRTAYSAAGLPPAPALEQTLRLGPRANRGAGYPYVRASVDGRETDFYEWRDALRHESKRGAGAMHRVASTIARVLHGVDQENLYVRVDLEPDAVRRGARATIVFPELSRSVPVPLEAGRSGVLAWNGARGNAEAEGKSGEDAGDFASDRLVEVRIPFRFVGAAPGTTLAWRVEVVQERAAGIAETIPDSDFLRTPVPPEDLGLLIWSVS